MALTLITEPQVLTPVYNDVIFLVDSDNKDNNGFQYVVDLFIYVAGVRTFVTRKKILPRPLDKLLEFNASRILQNYLTFEVPPDESWLDATNSYIKYDIDVYESYIPSVDLTVVDWTDSDPFQVVLTVTNTAGFNIGDDIIVELEESTPIVNFFQTTLTIPNKTATTFIFNDLTNPEIYQQLQDYALANGTPITGIINKIGRTAVIFETSKLELDNEYTAFNGVLPVKKFILNNDLSLPTSFYSYSEYLIDNVNGKALTNLQGNNPNTNFKLREGQTAYLNFYEGETVNFRITSYNEDGTVRQVRTINQNGGQLGNVNTWVISPNNVAINSTYTSGTNENFINSNVSKFSVGRFGSSTEYYFKLDKGCSNNDEYEILFLDRLGSMFSFIFNGESDININREDELYGKIRNLLSNENDNPSLDKIRAGYNQYDSSKDTLRTTYTTRLSLNIQWLSEEENDYIQELFTSPKVFIKKVGDEFFQPVTILTKRQKIKKFDNDFNYEYNLRVEISNKETINW